MVKALFTVRIVCSNIAEHSVSLPHELVIFAVRTVAGHFCEKLISVRPLFLLSVVTLPLNAIKSYICKTFNALRQRCS